MSLTRVPEFNQKLGGPADPVADLRVRLSYVLRDMAQLLNATAEDKFSSHYNAQPAPPSTGNESYAVGDFVPNSNQGVILGTAGAQFLLKGWRCTASGIPGTWTQVLEPIDIPTGFQSYTPTIAPTSGTLTAYTAFGRYLQVGKIVHVQITIQITTNGTAAGFLGVFLPVAAAAAIGQQLIPGRETAVVGKMLQCFIGGGLSAGIANYDNSYPGGNGYSLCIQGAYEAA